MQLATGAWYDPLDPLEVNSLDKHGNANLLTQDRGSSRLSQGCSAQSTLAQVERFTPPVPTITAFQPPRFLDDPS
jgi:biotin/methionine sulfoxide reductase